MILSFLQMIHQVATANSLKGATDDSYVRVDLTGRSLSNHFQKQVQPKHQQLHRRQFLLLVNLPPTADAMKTLEKSDP